MTRKATIEQLAQWVRRHDDYVLIGHVHPDGDAVGTCMAVCLALRALGRRAFVCLPDPVPRMYAGYPHADEVVTAGCEMPFEPKTAFALDVSETFRMGGAQALFDGCADQAVLDHHGSNPGFGDLCCVDGQAAAAGQLAMRLLDALDVNLTDDMALWLFVALSTDTGHFRFSSTSPETFRCAARLVEAGADVAALTRDLWYTRSEGRTRLLGAILGDMQRSVDGRICWSRLTRRMLLNCMATLEDNEGAVNYLLEVEGVELAVLAEERGASQTKFSLRSKADVDVSALAARFGGGGHRQAAGCTIDEPIDAALDKLLRAVAEAIGAEL